MAMTDWNAIARRNITRLREAAKLTYADVAKRAPDPFDPSALSRFENGSRGTTLTLLGKVAKVLGVGPQAVFSDMTDEEIQGLAAEIPPPPPIPKSEKEFVNLFRKLPKKQQRQALSMLRGMLLALEID